MRLYDNSPDNYHDELASWFPSWYRGVLEMDALWQMWGAMLDQLQKDILQMLDNNFLPRCDEATIRMWEEFLSIAMVSSSDLENRRRFIMMHFGGFGKCSATKIKGIIKQYTGSDSTVSFEDYDEYGNQWLNIQMERGDAETLYVGDVQFVLEKIIPAHILHSLRTFRERNVRSTVTISRYRYEYSQAGLYPETSTIGKALDMTDEFVTDVGKYPHQYHQANPDTVAGLYPETTTIGKALNVTDEIVTDVSKYPHQYNPANPDAVTGIYPETATLGRATELVEAVQSDVSVYPISFTQASENVPAGTLPGSSTQ